MKGPNTVHHIVQQVLVQIGDLHCKRRLHSVFDFPSLHSQAKKAMSSWHTAGNHPESQVQHSEGAGCSGVGLE